MARAVGRSDLFARAALGVGLAFPPSVAGEVDELQVRLLEEALAILPEREEALRVNLVARLTHATYWQKDAERSRRLGEEALALARRSGNPYELTYALCAYYVSRLRPLWRESLMPIADEMVLLSERTGNAILIHQCHLWRLGEALRSGDRENIDQEVERVAEGAERLRSPQLLALSSAIQTTVALLEGRVEDAERHIEASFAIGQRVNDPMALQHVGAQLAFLRELQGRLKEVELAVSLETERSPHIKAWRAGLAVIYYNSGRADEARREFEALAEENFSDIGPDVVWMLTMSLLAEICTLLRDSRRAARLYELLLPHAGEHIAIALVFYGGPVARCLALLAATISRDEEAVHHFE
ncbi:MAG: hypothetical protein ACRD1Z_13230, partial [Vicinamibacteria bacterium]